MNQKKSQTEPATKQDLILLEKRLTKQFATKKDLKKFATKEDLKRFATKEDLKRFATKEDLKRFATKEDLKDGLNTLETKMDIKLDRLEERVNDNAKRYRDDVLNKMDQVMGQLETIREEQVLANHHFRNIEKRVEKLEKLQQAS